MKTPKKLFLKKIKISELDDKSSKTVVGGTDYCGPGATVGNCSMACAGPSIACPTLGCQTLSQCSTAGFGCVALTSGCSQTSSGSSCGNGVTFGTCSNCTATGSNCATSSCGGGLSTFSGCNLGGTWGGSCY